MYILHAHAVYALFSANIACCIHLRVSLDSACNMCHILCCTSKKKVSNTIIYFPNPARTLAMHFTAAAQRATACNVFTQQLGTCIYLIHVHELDIYMYMCKIYTYTSYICTCIYLIQKYNASGGTTFGHFWTLC